MFAPRNQLLRALNRAAAALLVPGLQAVTLEVGKVLYVPGQADPP